MKTVSFVNLKGGVGKTTLAVSFASYLAHYEKKKVLLIDLDPQTNASFWVMGYDKWDCHKQEHGTVADLMGVPKPNQIGSNSASIEELIHVSESFGFDILPSNLSLFTIDLDLAGHTLKELKLKRALDKCKTPYDYVICDCPPNLTIPTQNALAVSTHYVIPIALDYFSAIGIGLLQNRITTLSDDLDNHPELAGIAIGRAGSRPGWHKSATEADIRSRFSTDVLTAKVKDRQAVAVATQDKTHVFDSSDNNVVDEFEQICSEIYERIQ